jgi:L-asparaginase
LRVRMTPQLSKLENYMKIALLVTGGTLDKGYDELTGALTFTQSCIEAVLAQGRSRIPARVEQLMLKDSLEMTATDRRKILAACRNARESSIVITHGTDTMEETARFLAGKLAGKTIVLTGAMIPARFGNSDAPFNLGCAFGAVQVLPPGVYVAMNGEIFPAAAVTKNRARGFFQTRARV